MAITLPDVNDEWLSEFGAGVFELCEFYNVQLIGGDTTQGPLSITITAQGFTPEGIIYHVQVQNRVTGFMLRVILVMRR